VCRRTVTRTRMWLCYTAPPCSTPHISHRFLPAALAGEPGPGASQRKRALPPGTRRPGGRAASRPRLPRQPRRLTAGTPNNDALEPALCAWPGAENEHDHRTRIQEPGAAGLQPHSAHGRGLCGPRNPAVALPQAGPRPGDGATASCWNRWSAASASAATASSACPRAPAARQRLRRRREDRGGARRPGGRNRTTATRWTSSPPTSSASRWRCGPACRASAAAWPATSATTRCATSRRSWSQLPARHPGLPRHPAAAVRGAGGHRQPLGQALPDRLRRPGPARGLRQRQEAPARTEGALKYSVSAPVVKPSQSHPAERELRQGRLPGRRWSAPRS
jgi:hypothetical protein